MRITGIWIALAALWLVASSSGAAWASTVPIPEPTSAALLAVGLGGIALAKLRRRK